MIGPLLEVRGIRHAALMDAEGHVLTSAGIGADHAAQLGVLVASGRAVIASLRSATGASTWTELMLDVEGGPVLLTPTAIRSCWPLSTTWPTWAVCASRCAVCSAAPEAAPLRGGVAFVPPPWR
ncbi:roadblock/LC7 domain-containing protein [Deinococcus malanensis]|uniref:roadblock/LC7 domain-containing protein n=1 Tax=Deinococcus malanensis TaxID=1706855 RepID=UPI00363AAA07